jgi:hypothetical protein
MRSTKNFIRAVFFVGLGLAVIYSLMLPDPKGIGLFVLTISFSVLATVGSVVITLAFRNNAIKFVHYIVVVSNIVNLVLPFFWMRHSIKIDTFVIAMLVNHFVGLVAGADALLKIIDRKTDAIN